ncbi:hypothetical protein BD779DRAFT_1578625 [Infundibulicybe gibba]|nr:hypothetical protein BD779DRAFT_1578625 [Infundibulicybe gibba]
MFDSGELEPSFSLFLKSDRMTARRGWPWYGGSHHFMAMRVLAMLYFRVAYSV